MSIQESRSSDIPAGPACLVLMFKAPSRSKRRIAETLGPAAEAAADRLFECAAEDMREWPGPVCFAPADVEDAEWLARRLGRRHRAELQGEGDLGTRIETVSARLADRGLSRQIFIGIDCPELSVPHLLEADAALDDRDVVVAPADDGGVVLMGTRSGWPPLGGLPWGSARLRERLVRDCEASGRSVALIAGLGDIDSVADLDAARARLAADERSARRSLCAWLDEHAATIASAAK